MPHPSQFSGKKQHCPARSASKIPKANGELRLSMSGGGGGGGGTPCSGAKGDDKALLELKRQLAQALAERDAAVKRGDRGGVCVYESVGGEVRVWA